MKKGLLGMLLLSFAIVGCGPTNESSTSNPTSEQTSSSIVSSSEAPQFASTSEYTDKGVSVSGVLSDLSIVKCVIKGKEYGCTIKADNAPNDEVTVTMSNPKIATFEGDLASGFTLKCLEVGGTILVVKDSEGTMLYRTAINVKEALAPTELTNYIVNDVRYYDASWSSYDNYQLTFSSATAGFIVGQEGTLKYDAMSFTYKVNEELQLNRDMWGYELTITMDDSKAPLLLTNMFMYATGSTVNVYTKIQIVSFFVEVK